MKAIYNVRIFPLKGTVIPACEKHSQEIKAIAIFLGCVPYILPNLSNEECSNCLKEEKSKALKTHGILK
jgi:hypothetical protein